MLDGSVMRSGLANVTPVIGLDLPRPPTPPSNALLGGGGWSCRSERDRVVDRITLWNFLLDNGCGVSAWLVVVVLVVVERMLQSCCCCCCCWCLFVNGGFGT